MSEMENLDYAEKLASSINSLYQEEIGCDFTVRIESESFAAHRVVLSACSDYFKAMFSGGKNDKTEVKLMDCAADLFKQCLEFMYTGETQVTRDNVKEMLHAAHLIQQKELVKYCFHYLELLTLTDPDCCFVMKLLAQRYNNEDALIFVNKFIVKNLAAVLEKVEYCLMTIEEVLLYISSFYGSHEVLWKAIETWMEHDGEERRTHLCELAKAAKIDKFPFRFLMETVWESSLVGQSKPCKNLVVEAMLSDSVCDLNIQSTEEFYVLKRLARDYRREISCKVLKEIDVFVARNFESAANDMRFTDLSSSDVMKYLKCFKSRSEITKWNAALRWVKHDRGLRSALFPELLRCIDIDEMPLEFIQQEIRAEDLVKRFPICKEAMIDALFSKVAEAEAASQSTTVIAILNKKEKIISGFNVVTKKWETIIRAPQAVNVLKFSALLNVRNRLYVLTNEALYQLKGDQWNERLFMTGQHTIEQAQVFNNCIYAVEKDKLCRYDTVGNKWEENLPTYRWRRIHSMTATSEHLYIIGERGGGMKIVAKRFDPDSKVWTEVTMSRRNAYGCACSVLEGMVYVLGGGSQLSCVGSSKCEFYHSFNKSWMRIAKMQIKRRYFQAIVVNGNLYAVGGGDEETNSIEVFDKENNRWQIVADMKTMFDPAACSFIEQLHS